MVPTFIAIFTAHVVGSFITRAAWRPAPERRIEAALLFSAIVTLVSYLLLGTFHWQILTAIFVAHLATDVIAAYQPSDSLAAMLVDQAIHLAVLLGLAFWYPGAAQSGWWITGLTPELAGWYYAVLSFTSGLILCVPVGGTLIARLTRRFADEIRDNDIAGLTRGGQYIGWLERFLVLLLLLMNQPNGIGFLIAAKSILRFGEIQDPAQRKVAEYIIIGTFLSFGWALAIGGLTQKALRYFLQ